LSIANRLTFSASTITDSHNILNIDIFVEPTRREGFGMSVLQAMASGIPVVACGVGGIYGLIDDGVNGLLVPANDCEAMAAAICRLLASPELRAELAQNARQKVEKEFSAKVVAEKIIAEFVTEKNSPDAKLSFRGTAERVT
jgi:glycosyltransferase involved in cell wall biosynthesis